MGYRGMKAAAGPAMEMLYQPWIRGEEHIPAEGAAILDLLDNADLSGDEALADVVARLRRHSVLEETREMAQDWVSRAIESIRFLPEGEVREELVRFARLTVDRSA